MVSQVNMHICADTYALSDQGVHPDGVWQVHTQHPIGHTYLYITM